ncbi:HAD family hydrolase [Streptomyces bathyalis]|uniref:HAD family hydrolase n=1 Tax=Streptomyces bathyalis TaxID=2710756 RepID=A0A7T1T4S1_9ACTN|nr:HAD family hydrolase [Streptomyces bathyalis]QPP06393.1 HAD family hydrolase [Streptomyces bathyalis]
MPIRGILWDIDDTLFDYTGSDRAGAMRHIEAEMLLDRHPSPEAALGRWQEVMEEQFARFLSGELGFLEHRRERARGFLGTPLTDEEADAWFGRYVALYEQAWTLFPDAVPALDALTPGYRHGALSNSSTPNQERKLRRLGIRDRFEVLLCADELGHAKPAPEAFRAGCDAMGLPPAEVAYVGDRHDIDARAADDAGLRGIWIDRTWGHHPGSRGPGGTSHPGPAAAGVRRITGLAELPGLLAALL